MQKMKLSLATGFAVVLLAAGFAQAGELSGGVLVANGDHAVKKEKKAKKATDEHHDANHGDADHKDEHKDNKEEHKDSH